MAGLRKKKPNGLVVNEKQPETSTIVGSVEDQRTNLRKWRLLDERGRQTWHYLQSEEEVKSWPQSTADKYFLGLPTV